ncbi:SDR family NAD(P)-dependent oxidoreductase [Paracnuella aquatica]|uniref:SDR family NAD(P)-dependent oxidoreductase n=1 Tax=Paracnuella aquatica TaxID=2268757 RepID=UPI000DEFFF94|nr:SDR family oxidoreductase [Paracnuella aquatica]RPD50846.1 SDR family oxidoreductase [Paracnuella aquatica]
MIPRIALITGGSRGLGKDMALACARKGMDVVITYNQSAEGAQETIEAIKMFGGKAEALQLNVGDIGSFDGFLQLLQQTLQQNWGVQTFDYLVNNAGHGGTIPIAQMTEEAFDNFVNVHFKGVYFLTQKALNIMNDGGAVVNISTGTTRFCVPGYSVYSSMKSAIETFTKYVAKEYGGRGIRCNVVAPGPIETDFNNAAIRNNPQMKGFLSSQSPLGRVGEANDIGGVVAFLCSEDAKWINGQRIEVSGGINL